MLYLFGIGITFFLAFILINKKGKTNADKILAAWLFVIGFHLFLFYFYVSKSILLFPFLFGFDIPLPLLHGPFLFLYTSALTNQKQHIKNNVLHFIPFILAVFSLYPFFILTPDQKIMVYQSEGKGFEIAKTIILVAIIISGIYYISVSLMKLSEHRKKIAEQFSYSEKINLKWLYFLIIGLSIIWILVVFADDKYIYFGVVIYVLFIGYFGIKQVGIFTNTTPEIEPKILDNLAMPDDEIIPISAKIKYEKTKISPEEILIIHQKLTEIIQNQKVYKDPELTLSDLAQKVNVHANTLSQVINTLEKQNFYDYINFQRIDEFKRIILLPENQKFTLLSLAFECGFNSKTAFNRNFKKATTLSPSEYLKQTHIQLS